MPATTRSSYKEQAKTRRYEMVVACTEGDLARVKELGASCKLDWEYDDWASLGFTPLHAAAAGGHMDVLRYLVADCGMAGAAYVEAISEGGGTPLQVACFEGHYDVAKWLVSEQGVDVDAGGCVGTPLSCAARQGDLDMVKWLVLEGGANVDNYDFLYGSAVKCAARRGHLEIVKWLVLACQADWTFTSDAYVERPIPLEKEDGLPSKKYVRN